MDVAEARMGGAGGAFDRAALVWQLVRGPNALIAAGGVLVGAWWAAGHLATPRVAFAAGAAFFLAGYANAFNDARDVAIDRRAHPERPLASGRLGVGDARLVYLGCALAGAALAGAAHPLLGAVTPLVLAAMWSYSVVLKRVGLVGNAIVALLASMPFLYGAVAAGAWRPGLDLALAAAPLHLAREVAKDLDDVVGDLGHRRTLPLAFGRPAALGVIVIGAALHVWGVLMLARTTERLTTLMIPAFVLLVLGVRRAVLSRPGAPTLLKAAMLAAMAALVLSHRFNPPAPS